MKKCVCGGGGKKWIICLYNKLIPQLGEHLRVKEKKQLSNGIMTQMLTCALSLLRDHKIYERSIEFVHRLPVLLAIFSCPTRERRRKQSTLSSTSASL